jgi:hypothetical protein
LPGSRHRHHVGEHLLHGERRADLDVQPRLVVARVGEAVHDARRDLDHVAGACQTSVQPDPEAHAPGEHLEAFCLDRVDVRDRHRAAGEQSEIESEQLPAGAGRGVRKGEALARLSGVDAVAGLLDGPRARGAFLLRSSLNPRWSLRIEDEAPLTVMAMVQGDAWVLSDGSDPVAMGRGDVAVFRGPDPYTVASHPATPPQVAILPRTGVPGPQP